MIYVICALRDRQIDAYGQPFFTVHTGTAIRSFGDAVNMKDSTDNIRKHPEDFDLYMLGTFDDSTAHFDLLVPPRMLAVGKDQVRE